MTYKEFLIEMSKIHPEELNPNIILDSYSKKWDCSSASQLLYSVRKAWMKIVGFSDEEIIIASKEFPPVDVIEEIKQFNAALRINNSKPKEK